MRILWNIIYFFLFLGMAFLAMFLGGVSGVAGTFIVMVEAGDMQENLIKASIILAVVWFLVIILRHQNKKVMKRRKQKTLE